MARVSTQCCRNLRLLHRGQDWVSRSPLYPPGLERNLGNIRPLVNGFHGWLADSVHFLFHEDLLAQLMNESMFAVSPSFLTVSSGLRLTLTLMQVTAPQDFWVGNSPQFQAGTFHR